ncbi:hypothetical protein VTN02DRAFT_3851 [Thermoascus thermophilus]
MRLRHRRYQIGEPTSLSLHCGLKRAQPSSVGTPRRLSCQPVLPCPIDLATVESELRSRVAQRHRTRQHTPPDGILSRPSVLWTKARDGSLLESQDDGSGFGSWENRGQDSGRPDKAGSVVASHPRRHQLIGASVLERTILDLQTTSRRWIRVCRPVFRGREGSVTVTTGVGPGHDQQMSHSFWPRDVPG